MQITLIPPEEVGRVWHVIEPYMARCAEYTYGRYTAEDIKNQIIEKNDQLWVAYDEKVYGAVVTGVVEYPRMKTLCMHFTGGVDLQKWKDPMLSVLRSFAKDMDCDVIESYGRPGWKRVFADDGFRSRFMFYELPVRNKP